MLDMIEVAKTAYAAYGRSTGNKNFRGEEMPTWDALPQAIRAAWVAAVTAAVSMRDVSNAEANVRLDGGDSGTRRDWQVGDFVRFAHMPDGPKYKILEITCDGLLELEGMSGQFGPYIFFAAS